MSLTRSKSVGVLTFTPPIPTVSGESTQEGGLIGHSHSILPATHSLEIAIQGSENNFPLRLRNPRPKPVVELQGEVGQDEQQVQSEVHPDLAGDVEQVVHVAQQLPQHAKYDGLLNRRPVPQGVRYNVSENGRRDMTEVRKDDPRNKG